MNSDKEKIKELLNSANNQNLFIGWHLLKNLKEYERGEFRDTLIDMFHTKECNNNFTFALELEGSPITGFFHKYKIETKPFFSYKIQFGNRKFEHKKKIPLEFYKGQKKAVFNKILVFLEGLVNTL